MLNKDSFGFCNIERIEINRAALGCAADRCHAWPGHGSRSNGGRAERVRQTEAGPFEAVLLNHRIGSQNHRALDHMLQFADVSRPRIFLQRFEGIRSDPFDLLAEFSRIPHGKSKGQHRNVVRAFAKRRNEDRYGRQPIVEILAERPVIRFGRQIAVGGRDDADVHFDRRGAADAFEFLFLQDTEQLRLQVEPHFRDFVEQQGATIRPLKGAFDPLDGAGEGALFVSEQCRFDQPLWERGAVQFDKWALAPVALVVDRACEEFLAGSRLALEQDGRARWRGHRDCLHDAPDRRRVTDDLPLVAKLHDLLAEGLVLAPQPHKLERLIDGQFQLLWTNRFGDVVDRAGFNRRDRVLDAGVSRQHDERDVVAFPRQQLDELEPRQPRHPIIGDDQIDTTAFQNLQCFRDAPRADRRMSGLA